MNLAAWSAALAAALLASAGFAGHVVDDVPAALFGAARLLLGGVGLALFAGAGALRALRAMPPLPLTIAALSLALFQWSYFEALTRGGVGMVALASAGSSPVAADALEVILGRRPAWRFIVVASLTAGAVWLLARGAPAGAIAFAVLSGAAYAVYAAATRQLELRRAGTGAVSTAAAMLLGGLLLLAPVADRLPALLSVRTTLVAIYLGLVATALAYALVIFSLRHLSASRTLTILLAQPLLAIAAGAWLLGEPVNATLAAAAAALAGALALRALPDRFFLPSLFLKGLHLAQPVPPRPSDR